MHDSPLVLLIKAGGGGGENALIVFQLNQRRFCLPLPHCRGRKWEEPWLPGLVSPGREKVT